jgi:hypothetical protein
LLHSPDINAIIVGFRGTDGADLQNWITNLLTIPDLIPYNGVPLATVHSGFLLAYTALKGTLVPMVKQALTKYPQMSLIITGHSLGNFLSIKWRFCRNIIEADDHRLCNIATESPNTISSLVPLF